MHENCFHDNEVITAFFQHFIIISQSNMFSHIKCERVIVVTWPTFATDIVTTTTQMILKQRSHISVFLLSVKQS